MRRLSTPIERIREHYEFVVVGSGYGGAIAAARLAGAGRRVALLERGKELHPGEFPRTTFDLLRSCQADTPRRHVGPETGLFDFHLNRDVGVLVGCGLGGTSLINSNVSLAPGAQVFDDERWPEALRGTGATTLEPYCAMAAEMLGATPFPRDASVPRKFRALQRSAAALGARAEHVPLNISFARGSNAAGVIQNACVMCGDCVTGCNHGAKNTTATNYLPSAVDAGAEIFTCAEVRQVARAGDRWVVSFDALAGGRSRFRAPPLFVSADAVVLAAGSLGSTEILLRSRGAGLPLSERLGERFTGNGDALAFAYDVEPRVQGVGLGRRMPSPASNVGPTITGGIELRDRRGRPMLVEEGAVPGSLAPLLHASLLLSAATWGRRGDEASRAGLVRAALAALSGPYRGPMDRTLTYLIMGVDDDLGTMHLERDRLALRWRGEPAASSGNDRTDHVRAAAEALGGTFLPDPTANGPFGRSMVTVHPLGGCVMGDDAEHGVVDDVGRVFDPVSGSARHPGLYVLDGAIVPRPLGVNPLLTISALAERACEAILAEPSTGGRGPRTARRAPAANGSRTDSPAGSRQAQSLPGLVFTEAMSGPFSIFVPSGVPEPVGPEAGPRRRRLCEAAADGERRGSTLGFVLTVSFDDLNALLRDPSHPGSLSGTVTAPELSPRPLVVTEGSFGLFVPDPRDAGTTLMRYRMVLRAEDGARFHFDGFKVLGKRSLLRTWPDTTTLYTTVRDAAGDPGGGTEHAGSVRGMGMLRLTPPDFARQLGTIRVTNVGDVRLRARYRIAFTRMFAGTLMSLYGRVLDGRSGPPAGRRMARSARPSQP